MAIRTFQPGDEIAKVGIYNEAAGSLPKFKPATLDEVRRRCLAPDFDKTSMLVAVAEDKPVGYASFHSNGRVSFPWCRKGQEGQAALLFEAVLQEMKKRGQTKAFAAYRGDWAPQKEFFLANGFTQAREMANYVVDLAEMPTPSAMPANSMTPLLVEDLPDVLALASQALRIDSVQALEKHLFQNAFFEPDHVFALRDRITKKVVGVGVIVDNAAYADPNAVDANMPCFRVGAFGAEGMTVKRLKGMFSFLVKPDRDSNRLGLELLGHAARRLDSTDLETMAAQVGTDAPHLFRFYQQYFRRQGAFPIFERKL